MVNPSENAAGPFQYWVAMTSCWIKYFNKEWPPTWLINILHAWCIDIRPLSEIEANPEICSANQNQSAITRNNTFYAYSWTDWIINALHWASKPRRLWGWPIFIFLISLTCYLISTRNSQYSKFNLVLNTRRQKVQKDIYQQSFVREFGRIRDFSLLWDFIHCISSRLKPDTHLQPSHLISISPCISLFKNLSSWERV